MLWGKKKALLIELLYFYGIVNTNVQMMNISPIKEKNEIFTKIMVELNKSISEIIFGNFEVPKIQKLLTKESRLKDVWSKKTFTPPKVADVKADYYS